MPRRRRRSELRESVSGNNITQLLVAWGRGIKRGIKLGIVDNIDVAPTIAALFGQKLPSMDGRVLREMLTDPAER